jgi:two-component system cell cycle response regulator
MKQFERLKADKLLPSPKGVALAIMQVCQRDDATTQDVAKIVQADPALSGRLIKQANSALRAGRPVAAVSDAIKHLGIATVRQLALTFSLVDKHLAGPCKAFDYPRFWSHSLLMALSMQELGKQERAGPSDELFTCGLFCRIGYLALASAYPAAYAELLQSTAVGVPSIERERERLETDHLELTAALLTDWGIPKALAEPIAHHEDPDAAGFSPGSRAHTLVQLLYMAKRLADLGMAEESERNSITADLMLWGGKIGIAPEAIGALVDSIMQQWREWGDLLKVPVSIIPPFAKMDCAPAPSKEPGANAMRVLLVEDNASSRLLLEKLLRTQCGHIVYSATNGREALAMALEVMPQVVITDWIMPEMDGLELCKALRAAEWAKDIYLLMLTSVESEDELIKAYEAGIDEYVTKPVNIRALQARLRAAWRYVKLHSEWERDRAQLKQFATELAIANRKLEHAAHTDPLTGLFNRRAAMTLLAQAWSAATRSNALLVVMAIDIDHFKSINDRHGHAAGDNALKEVAKTLRENIRNEDSLYRVGGEEFLVVCQNTNMKASLLSAERLRKAVQALEIEVGQTLIKTAVCIGVAQKEAAMKDVDTLVNMADKALYAAKNAGRNRTCLITQDKVQCRNA